MVALLRAAVPDLELVEVDEIMTHESSEEGEESREPPPLVDFAWPRITKLSSVPPPATPLSLLMPGEAVLRDRPAAVEGDEDFAEAGDDPAAAAAPAARAPLTERPDAGELRTDPAIAGEEAATAVFETAEEGGVSMLDMAARVWIDEAESEAAAVDSLRLEGVGSC